MNCRRVARSTVIATAMLILALTAAPIAQAAEPIEGAPRRVHLGLTVTPDAIPPLTATKGEDSKALTVRLRADWGEIERERGIYDWASIEPAVAALVESGSRIVLALGGTNPVYLPDGGVPDPVAGESLQGWTAFVRNAVRTFGGRIAVIELGDDPSSAYQAPTYAFVLKNAALAARAEARAAQTSVLIAQGAIDASHLTWQESLFAEGAAPYIDVLPVVLPSQPGASSTLSSFLAATAIHAPAPALWVYGVPASDGSPFAGCAAAVEALAASADTALTVAASDPELAARQTRWLEGAAGRLEPDFAPAPNGGLELRTPEGESAAGFRVVGRFFHQKDFRTLVFYEAPLDGLTPDAQARLILDTIDVKDPRVVDPLSGADLVTGPGDVPGITKRSLRVLRSDSPMIALWERLAQTSLGLESESEKLEVEGRRGLTAEEIIARYQEVQKVQDDRLERWMSPARVDFNFKFAQSGSTFDIGIGSNYFWERGGPLEWEQTDYFFNGNRITWKNIPDLPQIQPEKVITLPLDLTLDKTYVYRLIGEDQVDDRAAYELAFEPADPNAKLSLYRGRVWIDKISFVRLKAAVLQLNLDPPVLSNEETDHYRPVTAPDGNIYWMLSRIEGQQLWVIGGRNFVVQRRLNFPTYEINPAPDRFAEARKQAYASANKVLRDTDQGFRYLERQDDGTRQLQETMKTSQLFALAGVTKDDSQDNIVPLAGVSWFDFDFLDKGLQASVFFAGVLAFANVADPSLGDSHFDFAGEAALIAIKSQDKVFEGGEEVLTERIRQRTQYGSVRLGHPLGSFCKAIFVLSGNYRQFDDDEDAVAALAAANAANGTQLSFVLPPGHNVLSTGLEFEFNRKGYTLRAAGSASRRSEWSPWGIFDAASQAFVDSEFDPAHKSYLNWEASAFKEWYLPKFQKIRGEVIWLDGQDLDRFSRYKFGQFGQDRLDGFAGTGVRFDRGAVARLGYAFNLFGAIRFDAELERARVKDEVRDDRWRSFTGAGLSGNVVGPWQTVFQFRYGRALQSDLDGLKGKQEFLLVVLKLF